MALADTQWPRYQVFLQEKQGEPFQDVGSVHAPDPELALMNARDVFVRRPDCSGLWVVPASEIFARTAQELEAVGPGAAPEEQPGQEPETYYVFCKRRSAGTQALAGEVQASTPFQALQAGIDRFSGEKPPFTWWVFPARLVNRSEPQDAESMFNPARDKPFRLSTDFQTLTAMRKIRTGQG